MTMAAMTIAAMAMVMAWSMSDDKDDGDDTDSDTGNGNGNRDSDSTGSGNATVALTGAMAILDKKLMSNQLITPLLLNVEDGYDDQGVSVTAKPVRNPHRQVVEVPRFVVQTLGQQEGAFVW